MSEIFLTLNDQEYKVWSDKNQWILAEYQGKTSRGDDDIRNTRYYSSIEDLIDGLVRLGIRTSEYESFEDIKENLNEIKQQVFELFEPVPEFTPPVGESR